MSLSFPEPGYTPGNLRYIQHTTGMKREQIAELLGVSLKSVHCWCIDLDRKNHRDMPASKWAELLEKLEK